MDVRDWLIEFGNRPGTVQEDVEGLFAAARALDLGREQRKALEDKLDARSWVDANERLPERWKDVIAVAEGAGVVRAMLHHDGKRWMVTSGKDFEYQFRVTHWMPLPEPPK